MYNPHLETFLIVADSSSLSKASQKLFISPTAVIKQINLLENEIGFPLFYRDNKGITLTDAGKSFYNDATYLVQYVKDSIARAKSVEKKNSHAIRLGTSIMTPCQFLLRVWNSVQQYCPEIKFELISFENTAENAREILNNLGKNIDIVANIYDNNFLKENHCNALELTKESICVAVPMYHPLAQKDIIDIKDLYGENLMLIRQGWNSYIDCLRDDLLKYHSRINIIDFQFYDIDIFNYCESSGNLLMAIGNWRNIHPLLKVIPVNWDYTIPFGIMYSLEPSKDVKKFIKNIKKVYQN